MERQAYDRVRVLAKNEHAHVQAGARTKPKLKDTQCTWLCRAPANHLSCLNRNASVNALVQVWSVEGNSIRWSEGEVVVEAWVETNDQIMWNGKNEEQG